MTSIAAEISVDLSPVTNSDGAANFKVHIDASRLFGLISDAERVHRVYELMLIDHPGDVWDYVTVEVNDVSKRVAAMVAKEFRQQNGYSIRRNNWTATRIAFPVFDRYFFSDWEDGTQEDEAWETYRASTEVRDYAKRLFALVREAQDRLKTLAVGDALLRHLLKRIQEREHPLCFMDRRTAIGSWRAYQALGPAHLPGFYAKLTELLGDPKLESVAFSSMGDHKVLTAMATLQRTRIEQTGKEAHLAFMVVAFVDPSNRGKLGSAVFEDSWEACILPFGKGNSHCDLFVQGDYEFFAPIKERVERDRKIPGRYILSIKDEGSVEGFDVEVGDGWFLYKNRNPTSFNYLTDDPRGHGSYIY